MISGSGSGGGGGGGRRQTTRAAGLQEGDIATAATATVWTESAKLASAGQSEVASTATAIDQNDADLEFLEEALGSRCLGLYPRP